MSSEKDFFISYNQEDRQWAEWIAWILEEKNYSVVIQAWDFRPGGNFVLEMQKAVIAHRIIAVLSENYINAEFTHPEWATAFSRDPKGEKGILIPVRVKACPLPGLLAPIIYVDIVELGEEEAQEKLIKSLNLRNKPPIKPLFPGLKRNFPAQTENPEYLRVIRSIEDISSGNLDIITSEDEEISCKSILTRYHNLPDRPCKKLIGREDVLQKLLDRISFDYSERIITITGIGGVGKTSLVLEASYCCLEEDLRERKVLNSGFDLIVFASAQTNILLPKGIIETKDLIRPIRTLQDLCNDIADIFKRCGLKLIEPCNQSEALQEFLSLGDYKILIILDNLESLENEDTHQILEFFRNIRGNHIKIVITTRYSDRYDLNLRELSDSASLEMIENLLIDKNFSVTDEFKIKLQQLCGGIPLSIQYSIGVFALEGDPIKVISMLSNPEGDLSLYCFEKLVLEIETKNNIAYMLLLTLSVSPYGFTRDNLFQILNISLSRQNEAINSLELLIRCSLVFQEKNFYKLLPLTRSYVASKLESSSQLESEIRGRWIKIYINIAQINGGEDQGEWHIKYDIINNEWKNFKEVFYWCQSQENYEDASSLWKSLCRFSYLYAYWADRLSWSDWLMDIARKRGDNAFLAEVTSARAWLTLLREGEENLQRAEEHFKNAWSLSLFCSPYIRTTIAINLAVLFSRKRDFARADYWFNQYMKLRKENKLNISKIQKQRLELRYLLYWGERYYRDGDYSKAIKLYAQVVKKSEAINWLRFKVKAFERLALISIRQDRLSDAEEFLQTWYPVTERNHDYRRMAFFQRDYAELEFKKNNFLKAKDWASKALQIFKDLKMQIRVQTTQELIHECDLEIDKIYQE
jgi:hypothetical protein